MATSNMEQKQSLSSLPFVHKTLGLRFVRPAKQGSAVVALLAALFATLDLVSCLSCACSLIFRLSAEHSS